MPFVTHTRAHSFGRCAVLNARLRLARRGTLAATNIWQSDSGFLTSVPARATSVPRTAAGTRAEVQLAGGARVQWRKMQHPPSTPVDCAAVRSRWTCDALFRSSAKLFIVAVRQGAVRTRSLFVNSGWRGCGARWGGSEGDYHSDREE